MGPIKKFIAFVLMPIFIASAGELLLKFALNSTEISISVLGLIQVLFTPAIFVSLGMIVCGGLLWLVAMSKYELSFIYPFLSLNYVIILLGSWLLLGEEISMQRVYAICLIIVGLLFISRSPNTESTQ
jgi:drug/metabolite transporter (DMT)-like permease